MTDSQPIEEAIQDAAIERALSDELEQHKGQWVAIFEDHVVAISDSAIGVRDEALAKGVTDPIVFRVPLNPNRLSFF